MIDEMVYSSSGYCMPFDGIDEKVELEHAYGGQADGSFRNWISLKADRYLLKAIADGVVVSLGSNNPDPKELGISLIIRYGGYDITYGGIRNALVGFGKKVEGGQPVAISGKSLIIHVKHNGQEIDPIGFLKTLYGLVMTQDRMGSDGFPLIDTFQFGVPTDYDQYQEELEGLMLRHYQEYLMEIAAGLYAVQRRTEQSLRNIFTLQSVRSRFFECKPTISNPLGLGESSAPIAAKVHNLIIGDFLNFLAIRHGIVLSSEETDKKKE